MAEEVLDGVWWLEGTRGSNVFALDTGAGITLVDTGFPGNEDVILEELRLLGGDKKLERILLTHAHRDHSGSARALKRLTGARVVIGAGDTREARSGRWVLTEQRGPHRRLTRVARMIYRRPVGVRSVEIDERLDGEVALAEGLLAIPTPGHTMGSYCFVWERADVAFVGDLVIGHDDGLARPMKLANSNDLDYLQSLSRFSWNSPASGCPGHGTPVIGSFGDELRELASLPRRPFFRPSLLRARLRRLSGFSKRIAKPRRGST